MIESLAEEDFHELVELYVRCTQMEKPPGNATVEYVTKDLQRVSTFVYKEDNHIVGFVTYIYKTKTQISIDFICSNKQRKGIGSALMLHLAKYACEKGLVWIYSTVSAKDRGAQLFYKRCGFREYARVAADYGGEEIVVSKVRARPDEVIQKIENGS